MKIRIITSCTGEKRHSPEDQLTQDDLRNLHDGETFEALEATLDGYRTPAQDLYTGQQHVRLMEGVRRFRDDLGPDTVDLWILSAGYGLIPGEREVVPYECTFSGMKVAEIEEWAEHLRVPAYARQLFASPADLILVLLGEPYLRALDLDGTVEFAPPAVFFTSKGALRYIQGEGEIRTVPLTNREAKRFSCGLVGLKGELAQRLLVRLTEEGESFLAELLDPETDALSLLDTVQTRDARSEKRKPKKKTASGVDRVIQIPRSWWEKPHRQKLRYFIPEWDDRVDPDYDFESDTHSGGTGDWANEVFAHQIYPSPNYDGILVSKVVAEKTQKKKRRINELGVHRYLRVPSEFPIMGDCGAFDYIKEDEPPYTTDEILDYYTRLGFDYGVSVDHLIVKATEEQKKFRYELTISNAEEFLREHETRDLPWTPIGSVQGWDAQSYAEAARQYVAMGYEYIALGGLVRTQTQEILRILDAVHRVVPEKVKIHLFGLARLNALREFSRLGVHSVDSASYLRRAWMGTGRNYFALDGETYTAIRIPEAGNSFRAKRIVTEGRATREEVERLEANCLRAVREYDEGILGVSETLDALLEYDHLIAKDRDDLREPYRKVLEAAPWQSCPCAICQTDGVEVIIFRGNNRNRRRGFHNTYIFYQLLQQELTGASGGAVEESKRISAYQPSLFAAGEGSV